MEELMNKIALTMHIAVFMTLGANSGSCWENMYPAEECRKTSPGNTTYYINPADGNDSNSGLNKKLAWRSFSGINHLLLSPGDRVVITSPGSFDQTLMLMGTGTAKAPVEISFAPGRYDLYPTRTLKRKYQISNT
ncbi:MAG: hypothetical protein DRP08_05640, partial [Candidatus Aenigmatarchaeota archaeon]